MPDLLEITCKSFSDLISILISLFNVNLCRRQDEGFRQDLIRKQARLRAHCVDISFGSKADVRLTSCTYCKCYDNTKFVTTFVYKSGNVFRLEMLPYTKN